MSRHRRVERRGGLPGVALVVCACGAFGGDPRLGEPTRVPLEPAPASAASRPSPRAPEPAVAAARPPPSALPPSPPLPPLLAPPEPAVQWRFRSASPLSGAPAVSPEGLVYLASVEGYLHA